MGDQRKQSTPGIDDTFSMDSDKYLRIVTTVRENFPNAPHEYIAFELVRQKLGVHGRIETDAEHSDLVELARTDSAAWHYAKQLCIIALSGPTEIPQPLKLFMSMQLQGKWAAPKQNKTGKHSVRDISIILTLQALVEKYGIDPSANAEPSPNGPVAFAASHIVADALGMERRTIERIYTDRNKKPGFELDFKINYRLP